MKITTKFLVSVIILWLLFLPKIDLLPIGSFYIRLEDFLYLLLLPIAIQKSHFLLNKRLRFAHLYIIYLLFSFCSSLISYLQGGFDNILLSLLVGIRQIQYFMLLPIALSMKFNPVHIRKVALTYVYYSLAVSLLQSANILSVSRFSSERFMSVTNGPYEFAVQLILCIAILGGNFKYIKSSVVAFLSLLATSSRVTILGFLLYKLYQYICTLLSNFPVIKIKKNFIIVFTFLIFLLISFIAYFQSRPSDVFVYFSLLERIKDISLSDLYSVVESVINGPTELGSSSGFADQSMGYISKYYADASFDLSGLIRIYKYISLLRIQFESFTTILWGVGPGYIVSALDSSLLRILIENGVFGFIVFGVFLRHTFSFFKEKATFFGINEILFNTLFTSFLIDIFWSSKVMPFFWLIIGVEAAHILKVTRCSKASAY